MQANADESHVGILDLADCVDRDALVDVASVYRRGESKPRDSNSLDDSGNWVNPPKLRQALETERARPWTAAESDAFVATQLRLREVSRGLGTEWPAWLARIEAQAKPLMAPADAQRLAAAQPSAAAAVFRSTTRTGKPTQQGPGAAPSTGPERSAPHRGPDGPEPRRGRDR